MLNRPIFSIMMCTKNSSQTLANAVHSLLGQCCKSWELLILDNGSTDESWNMIIQYMKQDQRIKGKRLEHNVGWAKGACILLKEAIGKYTTFLAADDFFLSDTGLQETVDIIAKEEPDIIWNGYMTVRLCDDHYQTVNCSIPEYRVYAEKDNKVQEIYEVMHSTYYNSFFHFMRIDFLKENNIDFYEPYFADYESMTAAMCRSAKSVIQNKALYALTLNTSQTAGAVVWNENIQQWKSIRQVKGQNNAAKDKLQYIAERILTNHVTSMELLCSGGAVRDKQMNPLKKTAIERLQFLEAAMEMPEWIEMLQYAKDDYMLRLFQCAKNSYSLCRLERYGTDEIEWQTNWIHDLVEAVWYWDGTDMQPYVKYGKENFLKIKKAVHHPKNIGKFGYTFLKILGTDNEEDIL